MRARINARFTELHNQRAHAQDRLDKLTASKPRAADPGLLDELPYLGDILPGLPPALKVRLFDIFDLTVTWNKARGDETQNQVTVTAVITDEALAALPEITNPSQDGYHDTATPATSTAVGQLTSPPIAGPLPQPSALASQRREAAR